MKTIALAAIITVALVSAVQAQTVIVDDGQSFTAAAGDISNLPGYSGGYDGSRDFSNNYPAPGQTFTTLGNSPSYTLHAITLQIQGAGNGFANVGSNFTLGLYSVSGSTLTTIGTETFTFNGATPSTGDYFTLNLATPVQLAASAQYAFTFNGGFGYLGLDGGYPSNNPYANGTAITVTFNNGTPGSGGTITTPTQTPYDRNFDIALTANDVPEPSTWALIAGGVVSLAGILRFRRQTI